MQLFLGTAEICQLLKKPQTNVTINSISSSF
jgi:hypothetical protein